MYAKIISPAFSLCNSNDSEQYYNYIIDKKKIVAK